MNTEIISSKFIWDSVTSTSQIPITIDLPTVIKATRKIIPKFKFYSGKISVIAQYPLSFEKRVKAARAKIKRMNGEEKWQLIEESFGMWEDYPENWLTRMREGTLDYRYSTESQITIHAISR